MDKKSDKIKIELNLDLEKIKQLFKKSLEIYYEALNQKRVEDFNGAYYNLILSLNLLNIIKDTKSFKNINDNKLQNLFDLSLEKVNNIITETKNELNSYYTDHLNQLINNEIRKKIDTLILQPLKLSSLYSINNKSILICGDDIHSKSYIVKYIRKKAQDIKDISIIHQSHKIDLLTKDETESLKILVILDDIDLFNSRMLDNLRKINTENVYLICTCSDKSKIPREVLNIFIDFINIELPTLSDTVNFLRYKIFNYLNYKDIFQSKYNIPLLENKNIDRLSQLINSKKKSYMDIDKIINIFFEICCQSSLQQNLFVPLKIEETESEYSLLNLSSILDKETDNPKYLYTIPKYESIIFENTSYININKLTKINFSYEDYLIKEIFVCEHDIHKKKGKIDIIGLIELEVESEELNQDFDYEYELSNMILTLYIHYIGHIILNKEKINKHNIQNKVILKFLELINTNNINLVNLNDLNSLSSVNREILLSVMDNFLFTDTDNEFNLVFGSCFSKNYYTYFLNIENLETKVYFSYEDHIEHLNLSKNMDIATEIRDLIKRLTKLDVSIEIIKNVEYYILNIEAPDDEDISNLKIFLNEQRVKSSQGLLISDQLYDLQNNYCFTNERDIDLLVEKFPQDYSHIYSEDEETWKYKKITKTEHLEFLKNQYSLRNKFYLSLLNFILLFQKFNESILSQDNINYLDNLIFDFQMMIDCMLFNTTEFNEINDQDDSDGLEKEELIGINSKKLVNVVWNNLWNTSYVNKEDDLDDENEYNFQKKISRLHKNFYIDILFLKRILKVFLDNNKTSIYSYYLVFKNKLESNKNLQELFIKGSINLDDNQNNIYSDYQITNFRQITKNNDLLENIIFKLSNRNNLYFKLFNNYEMIFIKSENEICCYELENDNNIKDLEQIGKNIIKNENYMSLFKLISGNSSLIMVKWFVSFILSCVLSYNKNYNYNNLFIACLLYKGYISNNKGKNIMQLLNTELFVQQILNKINYLYSINEVSYKIENKKLFKQRKCNIDLKYSTKKDNQANTSILNKYNISMSEVDRYIKTFNLKTEYFEDAIFDYDLHQN